MSIEPFEPTPNIRKATSGIIGVNHLKARHYIHLFRLQAKQTSNTIQVPRLTMPAEITCYSSNNPWRTWNSWAIQCWTL